MSVTADTIKSDISLSKYTLEHKLETVTNFLVLGNIRKVAELVNIPARTIHDWVHTEWWEELITRVRSEKKAEIDANLTRMIDKAGQVIEDKLENGDPIVFQGELMTDKKPVSAKDAAWIYGVLFDKQRLNRNEPTSISNNVSSEELNKLKAQFEQLSGKTIPGERID